MIRDAPRSTPLPYTSLFRSRKRPLSATDGASLLRRQRRRREPVGVEQLGDLAQRRGVGAGGRAADGQPLDHHPGDLLLDRKSTRLNSSHANISYAVFCLKKK